MDGKVGWIEIASLAGKVTFSYQLKVNDNLRRGSIRDHGGFSKFEVIALGWLPFGLHLFSKSLTSSDQLEARRQNARFLPLLELIWVNWVWFVETVFTRLVPLLWTGQMDICSAWFVAVHESHSGVDSHTPPQKNQSFRLTIFDLSRARLQLRLSL